MAFLDYDQAQQDFKARILEGIREHFPVQGKLQTLELENLEIPDAQKHADDIASQYKARVNNADWSVPVYGTLALKKPDGTVIDRRRVRLAEVPMLTRRHSYILGGKEWQLDNQWQLMPGVYTRRTGSGQLEARFNTPNTREFNLIFQPDTKQIIMSRGDTKVIPVYPLMKALGVSDDALRTAWGEEVFKANVEAKYGGTALERFYRADHRGATPPSKEEAAAYFVKKMAETTLRPEVTQKTLGKAITSVDGDTFVRATKRMLDVHSGAKEDDRDSIEFKDLRVAGDFVKERILSREAKNAVRARMSRQVNFATSVDQIAKFDIFSPHIKKAFTENSAARLADQVNPIEMLSASMQTTVMGTGGIQSQQALDKMVGLKLLNPSHFGFLDPIKTPENTKTGVTLCMPMGVTKRGTTPHITLFNVKTQKYEHLSPAQVSQATIALPDQVKWEGDKPQFLSSKVKASVAGNELEADVPKEKVDYVMRHPSQLFSVTSNLVPFLSANSGNRATYASRHIDQAISLKDREPPLVQVSTGNPTPGKQSWEQILGRHTSHIAPIGGKVTQVTPNAIKITAPDRTVHTVSLYNHFPTNDKKGMLNSTPTVKVGDSVERGQHLADTNFTKDGSLALGKNLRVAYIPYKGYNFEDGIVISETAAKKMTSEHLHKPTVDLDEEAITEPARFKVLQPTAFTKAQYEKVDEAGLVRVGTRVEPGDPLVLLTRPYRLKGRVGADALRKVMHGVHSDHSLRWEGEHPGEVVAVHKDNKGQVTVHVKTMEPMQVGDKLAGRYGNKGIATLVLPDAQMPHTKDGKPVEVLLNPSGVPGRMNIGQVFETVASKIAQKTGKPYIAEGFSKDSLLDNIKADLKKHGLSDTEELVDPQTGVTLGAALVGTQHMLKLTHQVDKKESVRSGMSPGETYARTTLIPTGGAKIGGQSIGPYGLFSLLSHGARANIREMQTWKSEGEDPQTNPNKRWQSQHAEVWSAIQAGHMLPTPKATFSYRRFEDMLRAAGVNVEKKGNAIQLMPLTNDQILKMSSGEIRAPHRLTYAKIDKDTGELKAYPGGLFDEKLTGGIGGKLWSHIKLPEPIPNPVFEGPIQRVLGLKQAEYNALVAGESAVSLAGHIVPIDTPGSLAGGKAFQHLLERVDVPKALAAAQAELAKLDIKTGYSESGKQQVQQKVDQLVKKVKYLRALDQLKLKASDAYLLHNVPVIPPIMRQPSLLKDGAVRWEDLNGLYQQLGQITSELPHILGKLPDKDLKTYRANVYDCVSAIQGLGSPTKDSKAQGILQTIKGVSAPKHGYFQKQLLNRKQDLTARSTVVPEPSLGLDEVGIPRHQALKLYQPFVVNKLHTSGMAKDVLEARKLAEAGSPLAFAALEHVVRERPVIMKRDPALHLHSVQAFTPRLVAGKAIQVHPLVTSGYNMDFDGDQVSLYVPIHPDAVQEARKMMPSNNLFNVATGKVTYTPTLEAALGLYKMSRIGQDTKQTYAQPGDAIRAVQAGKLGMIDRATIAGVNTTPGRILLASALPAAMRHKVLTDHNFVIDSKGLPQLFTQLAKEHPTEYAQIADRLKDIGNGASSGAVAIINPAHQGPVAIRAAENPKQKEWVPIPVHTLALKDFEPDKAVRAKHLEAAHAEVAKLQTKKLPAEEREARAVESYMRASDRMLDEHMQKMQANPTNLAIMAQAGVKPSTGQYRQMVLAPMVLEDAANRPIKTPVTSSYSEGLDVMGYWTQMHGARSGTIKKVGEVRDPGYFSKQLMQTSMAMVVAGKDCGTTRGLALPVADRTIHDRILAAPFKSKNLELPAGTLITPDIADQMRAANHGATALVRSTLKCEHPTGVCAKCAGVSHSGRMHEVGDNIGVQAAQSVGERAVQLMLKQFHTGGVRSAGGTQFLSSLDRAKQLTLLPETIPDAATLAMRSGRVEKVENDATGMKVWIGGKAHHVGKDRNGQPLGTALGGIAVPGWQPPKVGMHVEAGTPLSDPSRSHVNPHDLYRATGNMERVQNFLVGELHNIYKGQGVRRQHIEAIVGAMGQLSKVRDPGDSDLIRGDFGNAARIRALNKELLKAGKKPIEHSPVLKGINTLPHQLQEDWMARMMHDRLEGTILNAAATNGITNLHGLHPIPGAVFGAEFGLTGKHSLKPGLGHLKDVPDHAY